jgi:3',5'-cyclic AMP phosphodiesterase CpdA
MCSDAPEAYDDFLLDPMFALVLRRMIMAALVSAVLGCGDSITPPPASPPPPPPPPPSLDWLRDATQTVIVGAGDVGVCDWAPTVATADLLDSIVGTVVVLGDVAYPSGSDVSFRDCYDPTWGRQKARTRPVPGNHDYDEPGAAPYFRYFGAAAGDPTKGYYAFDLAEWRVFALNSEIDISDTSAQLTWLRQDLAANPTRCGLAYWHTPRFSSGLNHGNDVRLQPAWEVLHQAGVEVVLNGHEHNYERFAPQTPAGAADPQYGIREFVAGTGGGELYPFDSLPEPNSEVRRTGSYGVLALRLRADGYNWRFVPVPEDTFADSGSGLCHAPRPAGSRP